MLPRKPRLLIIDLLLLRTLRLIPILPDRASVGCSSSLWKVLAGAPTLATQSRARKGPVFFVQH